MSDHLDYIDDVGDVSTLKGKDDPNAVKTITAWFQRRLNIVDSKFRERQERFWDQMLELSKMQEFGTGLELDDPEFALR